MDMDGAWGWIAAAVAAVGGAVATILTALSKRSTAAARTATAAEKSTLARLGEYCDRLIAQMGECADLNNKLRAHITEVEADYGRLYGYAEATRSTLVQLVSFANRHGGEFGPVAELPLRRDPRETGREDFDRRQVRQGTMLLKDVDSKLIRPEDGGK